MLPKKWLTVFNVLLERYMKVEGVVKDPYDRDPGWAEGSNRIRTCHRCVVRMGRCSLVLAPADGRWYLITGVKVGHRSLSTA